VFSENEQGEKLLFKDLYSDREEAIVVCKDIQRIKRDDVDVVDYLKSEDPDLYKTLKKAAKASSSRPAAKRIHGCTVGVAFTRHTPCNKKNYHRLLAPVSQTDVV